ncbi:MAG TPA: TIM-barrel domain-containing protein [Acidimicrobiales bacterium]|nr:TIM-barrel domain-containing protein [Acidimicrobiales bacterium]
MDAGRYTGASLSDEGRALAVTYERATLHVTALRDELVRLSWGPGVAPCDVATRDAVFEAGHDVVIDVSQPDLAILATSRLRVEVATEGVVVFDDEGRRRYEERTPLLQGSRRVLRRVLRDTEVLCGLGEQARGLDLTGATYRLWNRDPGGSWGTGQDPLYSSIPVTVGLHETGPVWAFTENTFEATVTVGRVPHAEHGATFEFEDGAVLTYVAVGELDGLLETATTLLGKPAMPPRWALGYHHSRWGWRTDDVVADVVAGFASRHIPVSAMHLDIDHMDRFRVFTFDQSRFGRVRELAATALETGTRLVAIVDPAVRRDPTYELYEDGVANSHFVVDKEGRVEHGTVWPGWAAFPDFARASSRAWWSTKYDELTTQGIAGAWHDMNEPTSITLWGDRTLPRDVVHDFDGRAGTHAEAHNLYGLLMDKAGHDALSNGATRPFVLSRSGWAGLARYAWHWTADVESSPPGLAQQVPTFLGLGLSSVPFTGSDIGGFSGIPTPELYVRWLELGIVSPFCRTHCVLGSPDREPWRFPAPFDVAIERLIRARYRLLPHLYRLAEEAHRRGAPMLRPADWPIDGAPSGTSARTDLFYLGDELVVVPVADPAATSVGVTLPAGRWRRVRLCAGPAAPAESEPIAGGAHVVLDAPLGEPVMLQREGTILVLDDAWLDADTALAPDHATKRWSIHVHPDARGDALGVGFEDAGDGFGAARADTYRSQVADQSAVVTWAALGDFERIGPVDVVLHASAFERVVVDGAAVSASIVDGATVVRLEGTFRELVASERVPGGTLG